MITDDFESWVLQRNGLGYASREQASDGRTGKPVNFRSKLTGHAESPEAAQRILAMFGGLGLVNESQVTIGPGNAEFLDNLARRIVHEGNKISPAIIAETSHEYNSQPEMPVPVRNLIASTFTQFLSRREIR